MYFFPAGNWVDAYLSQSIGNDFLPFLLLIHFTTVSHFALSRAIIVRTFLGHSDFSQRSHLFPSQITFARENYARQLVISGSLAPQFAAYIPL